MAWHRAVRAGEGSCGFMRKDSNSCGVLVGCGVCQGSWNLSHGTLLAALGAPPASLQSGLSQTPRIGSRLRGSPDQRRGWRRRASS
jgi:hypothetical protein